MAIRATRFVENEIEIYVKGGGRGAEGGWWIADIKMDGKMRMENFE